MNVRTTLSVVFEDDGTLQQTADAYSSQQKDRWYSNGDVMGTANIHTWPDSNIKDTGLPCFCIIVAVSGAATHT
jgi:hypothetical protein